MKYHGIFIFVRIVWCTHYHFKIALLISPKLRFICVLVLSVENKDVDVKYMYSCMGGVSEQDLSLTDVTQNSLNYVNLL